jgi:ubiquitin carboxyl-terminal hydrolase 14
MQQDADEALNTLLNTMSTAMTRASSSTSSADNATPARTGEEHLKFNNTIDEVFGGEYKVTLSSDEASNEQPITTYEIFRKLRCYITADTTYLLDGLQSNVNEKIERRSESLARNAVYNKKHEIVRLPQNLIVQFIRFEWRTDTQKKAKKLKKVDFPMKLDIMPLCDSSVRASLSQARKIAKSEQDLKLGLTPLAKKSTNAAPLAAAAAKPVLSGLSNIRSTELELKESDKPSEKQMADAQPIDTTGFYELYGVVTHKGRYADSGHYIGWVRQGTPEKYSNNWWKFDDDKCTQVTSDDVSRLSGGGDHDMAYLLLYRRVDDMKGKEWKIRAAEDAKAVQAEADAEKSDDTTTTTTSEEKTNT